MACAAQQEEERKEKEKKKKEEEDQQNKRRFDTLSDCNHTHNYSMLYSLNCAHTGSQISQLACPLCFLFISLFCIDFYLELANLNSLAAWSSSLKA